MAGGRGGDLLARVCCAGSCVGESDIRDFLEGFPNRTLTAAPSPFVFDRQLDPVGVGDVFAQTLGVDGFDELLTEAGTQAFIVVKEDAIVYESYFNGIERDSMLTSFSVARSVVSALVGIAIDEGHIRSVDDAITVY